MSTILQYSECLQYAGDSIIYQHCKITNIGECVNKLEKDLSNLIQWSKDKKLAFNSNKTKVMLLSTQLMERPHKLNKSTINIICNEIVLERVEEYKLLGIKIDPSLNWHKLADCYTTLNVLKHLKRYTPYAVRKQLAEVLIL